jgi:hypothetical protein
MERIVQLYGSNGYSKRYTQLGSVVFFGAVRAPLFKAGARIFHSYLIRKLKREWYVFDQWRPRSRQQSEKQTACAPDRTTVVAESVDAGKR